MTYIKFNLEEALICATALKVILAATKDESINGDHEEKMIGAQLEQIIRSALSKLYEIEGVEAGEPFLDNKLIEIIVSRLDVNF